MTATRAPRQRPAKKRGPVCSVCSHRGRDAIDQEIVEGRSAPEIAARYRGISDDAIRRHAAAHLPAHLARAADVRTVTAATQTLEQLDRCLDRVNLLFDACDRWLRDPEDPSRYDLGPRAENLKVTYVVRGENGKATRKKASLAELLDQVAGVAPDVRMIETKHADPRELILGAVKRLESLAELLARVRGELPEPSVAVLVSPLFLELRTRLLRALEPYPDARRAAAEALIGRAG